METSKLPPLPPSGKSANPPLPPILSLFAYLILRHPVVLVCVCLCVVMWLCVGRPLSQPVTVSDINTATACYTRGASKRPESMAPQGEPSSNACMPILITYMNLT